MRNTFFQIIEDDTYFRYRFGKMSMSDYVLVFGFFSRILLKLMFLAYMYSKKCGTLTSYVQFFLIKIPFELTSSVCSLKKLHWKFLKNSQENMSNEMVGKGPWKGCALLSITRKSSFMRSWSYITSFYLIYKSKAFFCFILVWYKNISIHIFSR